MAFNEQKVPNEDTSFEFKPNSFYENENNDSSELDKLLKRDLSIGLLLANRPTTAAELKQCRMKAFGVEHDSKESEGEPNTMHIIEANFFLDSLMDRVVWEIERSHRKVEANLEAVRPSHLPQKDVGSKDKCAKSEGKRKRVQFTSPMTTNIFHYCEEEESQEDTIPLSSDSEEEFPVHVCGEISDLEQQCPAKKRKLMLTMENVHVSSFTPLLSTNSAEEEAVEGTPLRVTMSPCSKTQSANHSDDVAAGNSEVPELTLKANEENISQVDKKDADILEPESKNFPIAGSSDAIVPNFTGNSQKEGLCQKMPEKESGAKKINGVKQNHESSPVSKEVSVLISNESQDEIDEKWYAEVITRKFAENFDVEKMKEGFSRQVHGQNAGNGINSSASCSASSDNAHFLLSEEQLVPDNSASQTIDASTLSKVYGGCEVELDATDLVPPLLDALASDSHTIEALELSPIVPESSLDVSHDSQDCGFQIVSQEEVMLENANIEDSPCNSAKERCNESENGNLQSATVSFAAKSPNIEEQNPNKVSMIETRNTFDRFTESFATSTPIKNTVRSSADEYISNKDIDMGEETELEGFIEEFVHQELRAQIENAAKENSLDSNLCHSAVADDVICESQEDSTGIKQVENDTRITFGSEIDDTELACNEGEKSVGDDTNIFLDSNLCHSVVVDGVACEIQENNTGTNKIANEVESSFQINDAHGSARVGSELDVAELASNRRREPRREANDVENILIESNMFSSKMAGTCPVEAMGEEWSTRDSENAIEEREIFSPQMVSAGIAQVKEEDCHRWTGKDEEGFQKWTRNRGSQKWIEEEGSQRWTGEGGSQKRTGKDLQKRAGNEVTLRIADMKWCTREAESALQEPQISSPRVVRREITERKEGVTEELPKIPRVTKNPECFQRVTERESKIPTDDKDNAVLLTSIEAEESTGKVQNATQEPTNLCSKGVGNIVDERKDFTIYEQDISFEIARVSQSDEEMLIDDAEGFDVAEAVEGIFKPLFTRMDDHRLNIELNLREMPDELTTKEEHYLITNQFGLNQERREVPRHDEDLSPAICERVQSPAQRPSTTSKKIDDAEKDETIVPTLNQTVENSDLTFYEDDYHDHKQCTLPVQETPSQVPFQDISKNVEPKSAHEDIKQEDFFESEVTTPSSDFERQSAFSWGARRRLFNDNTVTNLLPEPDNCIVSNPVSSASLKQHTNGVNIQSKVAPRSVLRLGLSKKRQTRRLHPYWNASQICSDRQVVPDVDVSDE